MERREPHPAEIEYQRGQEMGRIEAKLENMSDLLLEHIKEQHEWNKNMQAEVNILKAWVQTTTGKFVILTSIFTIIGSFAYLIINWFLNHKYK